jgi:hypothetical protein
MTRIVGNTSDFHLGDPGSIQTTDNFFFRVFKMGAVAAMLDEWWPWSSKGTFLQLPPMSHQKIRPVDTGFGEKINGDQIQDGGHSGHLG